MAEETAIALALTQPQVKKIITDSQKAYASYRAGWVSLEALKVLKKCRTPTNGKVELIWTPAHSRLEGNELAHQLAQEMEYRTEESELQAITSCTDITQYYKEQRKWFPDPHKSLNRDQQSIYRQIQARSFPHPILQNKMFPERCTRNCPFC